VLFVLGMVAVSLRGRAPGSFDIPGVVSVTANSSTDVASFNPLYAYPIELDGHSCDPASLSLCMSDLSAETQQSGCCESLYDKNSYPHETVPNGKNYGLIFGINLVMLTLRAFFWRWTFQKDNSQAPLWNGFWFFIWWDSIIAFFISCAYTGIVVAVVKYAVSYPRPIYYALTIFSSVHESDRESLHGACVS
jgi:hypothetical protein